MTSLAGLPRLLRLCLRRDRVVVPVWIAVIAGLMAAVAASLVGLYTSAEERVAAATFSASNPIVRVFDGPAAGAELGALVVMEGYWLLAVLTALLCGQTVVRHTRADEEAGRAELLGAAPIGRHARLAAALKATGMAAFGVGASVTLVMVAFDLEIAGSLLVGATLFGVGLVFAGVAAVAAQVVGTARGANAVTAATLGVAFLLRAIGDAMADVDATGTVAISAWPSWLSPIGWGQQARAFGDERWWVLGLYAAAVLVLTVVAVVLSSRRDVGAGMLAARPGPATAGPTLSGPFGLAWRLHRSNVLAWSVAMLATGAAFGAVGEAAEDLVGVSDEMQAALEAMAASGGVVELYFTFAVGMLAVAVTAFTVQTVLRARSEELSGRSEAVLAGAVSRHAQLTTHAAIAAVGSLWLLTLVGSAGAVGYGLATGDWATGVEGMLGTALAFLPATLVVGAVVLLAVAVTPRAAVAIGWSALVWSLVVGQLGAVLELPQPVLNLSPFTHVPGVPAEPLQVLPLLLLTVVAAGLVAVAFALHRRRDLVLTA